MAYSFVVGANFITIILDGVPYMIERSTDTGDRVIELIKKGVSDEELLEVILADSESADLVKGELPEEMLDSGPYAVAVETVIQARMNDEWEDAPAMITQRLVECEFDMYIHILIF